MSAWHSIPKDEIAKPVRKQLKQLRTIRRNARVDARSGNPAKRYPALRAIERATALIGSIYTREAAR